MAHQCSEIITFSVNDWIPGQQLGDGEVLAGKDLLAGLIRRNLG
jgi:hypothetical protein